MTDTERKMVSTRKDLVDFEYVSLASALDTIEHLIAKYGKDSTLQKDCELYQDFDSLYVFQVVPESDGQMATRIHAEKRREQLILDHEKVELERLKAKYENQN